MATVTASEARKNLGSLLGEVNENHDVKAGNAVLIPESDYKAWQTTRHLFSTSANTRRLMESIQEWHEGTLSTQELPDDDEGDE